MTGEEMIKIIAKTIQENSTLPEMDDWEAERLANEVFDALLKSDALIQFPRRVACWNSILLPEK